MSFMSCFTDVGGSTGEITTSPAMLVSSPEKWLEFESRWNATLKIFGFTELHMKKFAHFRGEYESLRWDEPKRRRFLDSSWGSLRIAWNTRRQCRSTAMTMHTMTETINLANGSAHIRWDAWAARGMW